LLKGRKKAGAAALRKNKQKTAKTKENFQEYTDIMLSKIKLETWKAMHEKIQKKSKINNITSALFAVWENFT
jgi:hypothetical protein